MKENELRDKVITAIAGANKKSDTLLQVAGVLKDNQQRHYKWTRFEKDINLNYIDQELLNILHSSFGEGILKAALKKALPIIKSDLEEVINRQINVLNNP